MISLIEALKIMNESDGMGKPVPFKIEFFTADRKKKTGGELISLENVVLSKFYTKKKSSHPSVKGKSQNHWDNSTRNIKILSSGAIRKVHIRLIETINNKPVYW
jgi:hypothetical protein